MSDKRNDSATQFEYFIRFAFERGLNLPRGAIGRYGDPAGLANTDVFTGAAYADVSPSSDDSALDKVQIGLGYAASILMQSLDSEDEIFCEIEELRSQIMKASSLKEIIEPLYRLREIQNNLPKLDL